MANAKDIKEELLRQMDKDSVGASDAGPDSAQRIVETHEAQVRRLKWIAAAGWMLTILYFVAMHILKNTLLESNLQYLLTRDEFLLISYSDMGLKVLIVIAVLLTYLMYAKSKTLTMLQICARLANIEEHLKSMSQGA